jgi:hypothetical protein
MRRLAVVTAVLTVFAVLTTSVGAQSPGSKILSVTYPLPDPGLIDVEITDVAYDVRSGNVAVSGFVRCNAPPTTIAFVDYRVTQTRGGTTTTGFGFTESDPCDAPLHAVVEAPPGERFLPGKASIRVAAFACARSCARESPVASVLLIPERTTP